MKHKGVEVCIDSNKYYCEFFNYNMTYSCHHRFEASFVVDKMFDISTLNLKNITFRVTDFNGKVHSFEGIVMKASGCYNDNFFYTVSVSGGSPTLLLDMKKECYSFVDCKIMQILNDRLLMYLKYINPNIENDYGGCISNLLSMNKYGKKAKKLVAKGIPDKKLETIVPYRAQYNETSWSFIVDLLKDFNIPIWYSGNELIIGKGGNDGISQTLKYPNDFLYLEKENLNDRVKYKMELHNCSLALGDAVVVSMNEELSDKLRIVRKMIVLRNGSFTFYYEAIPCVDADSNLFNETEDRCVEKHKGMVVKNDDPMKLGRVRVQLEWQNKLGEAFTTNWIECARIDAGLFSSDKPCRGMFNMPEIGDNVIVSYYDNDYNDPYVSGCIYDSKSGVWNDDKNYIKSFSTRSGHEIVFDDSFDTGKILIKDCVGNSVILDSVGKTLNLFSPNEVKIESKKISLLAEEFIDIASDKETVVSGIDMCELLSDKLCRIRCLETVRIVSDKGAEIVIDDNLVCDAENDMQVECNGDLRVNHKKNCCWKGDGKIDLKSGVRVNIAKL